MDLVISSRKIMSLRKFYDGIAFLTTDTNLHHWIKQFVVHGISIKQADSLRDLADGAMSEALTVIENTGWVLEDQEKEDVISSKVIPGIGKVFKYEGILPVKTEELNKKLFYDVETSPEWNNNVEQANIIETINNQTNVVYFVSKNHFLISNRDFVHLRSWKRFGDTIVHSAFSVNHPNAPTSSFIRAEHRFCTYVMRPLKDDKTKTHLTWLMQVSLKGWLPQNVTDHAVSYGMLRHVRDIRSIHQH